MQALWVYFHGALFPSNRDILPDDFVTGVALAITRAGLEERHPYLLSEFDAVFLQTAIPKREDSPALRSF